MQDDTFANEYRRLLWWLLVATRGGEMRLKIIEVIRNEPSNTHRISKALGVNYRTVEHHTGVLEKNRLIISEGEKYGKVYFLSPDLARNQALIDTIRLRGRR